MFKSFLGRLSGLRFALIFAGLALLILITSYHIGSATTGLSPAEATAKTQSISLQNIFNHPVNGLHKLATFVSIKASPSRRGVLRLSSYLFAVIFAGCFYYLAKLWFGKIIGLLSTLVFCLSPFFLIPARLASAEIMFFFPVAIMATYYWLNKTKQLAGAWLVLMLLAGLAIYTPGMVWWIIGALIISRKKLLSITGELPQPTVVASLLLFVVLLVPAALAVFHSWRTILDFAALPQSMPQPLKLLENFGWMLSSLVVKTPYHGQIFLGRLALFNLIQLALLVFGSYAMWTAARSKAIIFGLSILYAVIVAAISNNLNLLLLGLPAAGIIMTAGLRYLYIEWRSVFPKNPIPKWLALTLMSVLVAIQLVYGVSYSLTAWPHSPATKSVYVLK